MNIELRPGPAVTGPADVDRLVSSYCCAWNEPDPERRLRRLQSIWYESSRFNNAAADVDGLRATNAHIGALRTGRYGRRFVMRDVAPHGICGSRSATAPHFGGLAPHIAFREHPLEPPKLPQGGTGLRHPRPSAARKSLTGNSAWTEMSEGVVSRNEESRRQFLRWAMWKKAGGTVEQDPQAAEIDDLIAGMPAPLRQTLVEVYLQGGGRSERAGPGCS